MSDAKNSAISRILDSAELCVERGQYKIAAHALAEAEARYEDGDVDQDDSLEERMDNVAADLHDLGVPIEELPKPVTDSRSHPKCSANCDKGRIGNGRQFLCFACQGKGYQTPIDITRQERYWEHRNSEVRARRQAYHNRGHF